MEEDDAIKFITESNMIEGIHREPTSCEVEAHLKFMELEGVAIPDLEEFVSVYQPDARLRNQLGMNVRVGNHVPPAGGPEIYGQLAVRLEFLLENTPYQNHMYYEKLHPFTDCNGRSGRMLWMWQFARMDELPLGFLHTWYYQSLDNA